jgi:hypothetical protein
MLSDSDALLSRRIGDSGGQTMNTVQVGGITGRQSAAYRPGTGWSAGSGYSRSVRGPVMLSRGLRRNLGLVTVARRRRLGLRVTLGLVALTVTVASALVLALRGGGRF